MSVSMIEERLRSYNVSSRIEEEQALREIGQECILAALSRTDFFSHGVFQGGTALRIFYGLNRFSEDLDFVLKQKNTSFVWEPYAVKIALELRAFGFEIQVQDRSKADRVVKTAFLKDDSLGEVLHLRFPGKNLIKIKLELDSNPPSGSTDERKIIDFPFVSAIVCQDLPSLFAGKIHALLCRNYVKGRDWYDFLWYTGRKTKINYTLLKEALFQSGPWENQPVEVNYAWCIQELSRKIKELDWPMAVKDVHRFLRPVELPSLSLWNEDLFLGQLGKIP